MLLNYDKAFKSVHIFYQIESAGYNVGIVWFNDQVMLWKWN